MLKPYRLLRRWGFGVSMELVANIRRLHFAEHRKVGTIATQLGVHHEAVERALGLDTRGGVIPDAQEQSMSTSTLGGAAVR